MSTDSRLDIKERGHRLDTSVESVADQTLWSSQNQCSELVAFCLFFHILKSESMFRIGGFLPLLSHPQVRINVQNWWLFASSFTSSSQNQCSELVAFCLLFHILKSESMFRIGGFLPPLSHPAVYYPVIHSSICIKHDDVAT